MQAEEQAEAQQEVRAGFTVTYGLKLANNENIGFVVQNNFKLKMLKSPGPGNEQHSATDLSALLLHVHSALTKPSIITCFCVCVSWFYLWPYVGLYMYCLVHLRPGSVIFALLAPSVGCPQLGGPKQCAYVSDKVTWVSGFVFICIHIYTCVATS